MTDIYEDFNADEAFAPLDQEVPPADEWADVPEDYREEAENEMPQFFDAGLGSPDRLAAEKLIKRYHRLATEEREAVQFVDDELSRLDEQREALVARRAELLRPIERKRQWLDQFRGLLEQWARAALEGKRERSIKLTYGAVKFRRSPDRLEVKDEAAAIDWASENKIHDALKTTVVKSVLKDYAKTFGEVPAGCELVPGEDTFSVEVGG